MAAAIVPTSMPRIVTLDMDGPHPVITWQTAFGNAYRVKRLFRASRDFLVMSLKAALNDPVTWEQFLEELETVESEFMHTLRNSAESHIVYRSQGGLEALRKVKRIKEVLNARK